MKKKILIAGQEGMVGSAIYKLLKQKKDFYIINCFRNDLDFTNQQKVDNWFKKKKPDVVINAAGKVGGILDNQNFQPDYIYTNTMIGLNIIKSSIKYEVEKLINLGSACIYPKKTNQPIKEDFLLTSKLEPTNEGYALAKILTLKLCQHLKKKDNRNFISLMPANLYGEGDNFNLKSSHVLPALVKKFVIAKKYNKPFVEVWGTGNVKREFLHVNDLALAVYFMLKKESGEYYLNVGGGEHFSIKNIANILKKINNYKGKIIFNSNYPDGVKRRQLDSRKIRKLGWKPKIKLVFGLKKYTEYYKTKILPKEQD